MKSQLKTADRSGARVALLVGPEEVSDGEVILKPLRGAGEQQRVPVAEVVEAVRATRPPDGGPDLPPPTRKDPS
jgi:histidyl-tRNA synthetase